MPDGIVLIVLLMFALIGLYDISAWIAARLNGPKASQNAVLVIRPDETGGLWEKILDIRTAMPDAHIVVLCGEKMSDVPPAAGWRGIVFAKPQMLARAIISQLDH